jgi:putative spermidine/putrescine transport system permease protein
MLQRSVYEKGWTLEVFMKLLRDAVFWRVMQITGTISLIVTVACLVLAYPVALFLARCRQSTANLLIILVLIPFWTSILVRTYVWMVLLGRRGIINNFLVATGVIDQPMQLLNTRFAVCVAMVHVLLPFMVLPIYSTLKSLDWRLIRAAEGLGARPLAVFRQVLLPLSFSSSCWRSSLASPGSWGSRKSSRVNADGRRLAHRLLWPCDPDLRLSLVSDPDRNPALFLLGQISDLSAARL